MRDRLTKVWAGIRGAIAPEDVLTAAGIAAVGWGVWRMAPDAALIVVGAALLYLGLWHGPLIARLLNRR